MAPFLNDDVLRAVVESIETVAEDNPEACCRREELISMIQLVLDQLPERYAGALEMKYIEVPARKKLQAISIWAMWRCNRFWLVPEVPFVSFVVALRFIFSTKMKPGYL